MNSAKEKLPFVVRKRPASALVKNRAQGSGCSSHDSRARTFTLAFADTGHVAPSLTNELVRDERAPVCPDQLFSYVMTCSVDFLAQWTDVEEEVPSMSTPDVKPLWKKHDDDTEQEDIILTERRWATIQKLKRCTPFGDELDIVCVKVFRGKTQSGGLWLDPLQREAILKKLVQLVVNAAVPTVVIGDTGLHMGSVLNFSSPDAAEVDIV